MSKLIKPNIWTPIKLGMVFIFIAGVASSLLQLRHIELFNNRLIIENQYPAAIDIAYLASSSIAFISFLAFSFMSSGKLLKLRSKIAFITLPNVAYAGLLLATMSFCIYFVREVLLLYVYVIKQVSELSVSFLPLPNYMHENKTLDMLHGATLGFCLLLAFSKPKSRMNPGFLIGLLVIPALPLFTVNQDELIISIMNVVGLVGMEAHNFGLINKLLIAVTSITLFYLLVVMPIVYVIATTTKRNIASLIKWLVGGYLSYLLASTLAQALVYANGTASIIKQNYNIQTVELNGVEYRFDLSVFTAPENDKATEYLIESYMGMGMPNSIDVFDFLMSDGYTGDKELAIDFLAKLHLRNYTIFSEYEDNFLRATENRMTQSDFVRGLTALATYEIAPLEMLERTLTAVIDKRYQDAIDYFIEDLLNAERNAVSSYSGKNISGGTLGNPYIQAIIRGIVSEGLAEMDLEQVKDEEKRKRIAEIISDTGSSKKFSNEDIERWYQMFTFDK